MIGSSESALCEELRRFENNAEGIDECRRPDIPAVERSV
jgi:hypothetical protein